jgi:hypothetical protein
VSQIQITLLANGIHSLERGFETLNAALPTDIHAEWSANSQLLLKEAIMFMHQGVELLLKQMLAQQSDYLIFSDVQKAAVAVLEARKQNMSVFDLKPPHTVSYEEAITRVRAFVDPPELDETLVRKLLELNRLRNSVEHYALQADRNATVRLLAELRPGLLDLFSKHIPDFATEATILLKRANRTRNMAAYLLRELKP